MSRLSQSNEDDFYEQYDRLAKQVWNELSGAAREVLSALCKHGPLYDGDVPSKSGRDELLNKALAVKIAVKNNEQGYQAATYRGSNVYRIAVVTSRQESVKALVGEENVRTRRV